MNRGRQIFQLSAVKVVIIYLILSIGWIAYTDQLVERVFDDPATITVAQTWKGMVFICMSAMLLYWMIRRSEMTVLKNREKYKTERETLLKESEEQYRRLFEENPSPMWIYDPQDQRFMEVNEAAIILYGYTRSELLTMTLFDLHPEDEKEKLRKQLETSRSGLVTVEGWTHLTKSGEKRVVNVSALDIHFQGKSCRLVVASDVTNQKKAEERVISSLMEGAESERRRIAKDLHDGLGQYLAAARMNLESASDGLTVGSESDKQFQKGLNLLTDAVIETRRISQNLLPKAIEDFGLSLAVASWIEELRRSYDVTIYYRQNLDGETYSDRIQLNLYRILQESITNAIRHSNCSRIDVQLHREDSLIECMVEDDGIGFDLESVGDQGLGLASIRNRTSVMGGELDISSSPGEGTCLRVTVPLGANDVEKPMKTGS